MIIPEGTKPITDLAKRLVDICRVSVGQRGSSYQSYGQWVETGRASGNLALANLLYSHVDRLSSYLFSAVDLRFAIDFERLYGQDVLDKGSVVARVLSKEWQRRNIDITFGAGVKQSLIYGSCLLKQVGNDRGRDDDDKKFSLSPRLVMPWQFGVYNETVNNIHDQEALCETIYLSEPEVWRRIAHLDDADKLLKRIKGASTPNGNGMPTSYMHQVLSTAVLDTSLSNATTPQPGGIVQLTNSPNTMPMSAAVDIPTYQMHEIWVKDDSRKGDYVTIQLVEPDILIAPRMKRANLFCPDVQPYTLIQPNFTANYFWGRSEITDLQMLQNFFTQSLDDIKRLLGNQFDKLLAFIGGNGITDETYGEFRTSGYINMEPGSSVSDLTPKIPDKALEILTMTEQLMEKIGGFTPTTSGRGEQGVRAGVHAETLVKTSSPRLRDRALLVERQCASAGDQTMWYLEAKESSAFWTKADDPSGESDFLLSQIPDDRSVEVDSHSTSPIFQEDHREMVAFLLKAEIIDKEDALEMLPIPNRDRLLAKLRQREKDKAKVIAEHPELLAQRPKAVGGHR